ncbi:MAG: hypothetical protein IKM34_00885 [Clostridia bacterium]|nr:hypothetical protein [Clostridia bacterium]
MIFPEDSAKGYLDVLEGFHAGFTLLTERCLKKGMDVPIYVAYYQKESKTYLVDKPVMLSELFAHGGDRFAIAKELCERCNALGQMDASAVEEEKAKEETVKKIYVA